MCIYIYIYIYTYILEKVTLVARPPAASGSRPAAPARPILYYITLYHNIVYISLSLSLYIYIYIYVSLV